MSTHTLRESDWENFVAEEILPIITRPRNQFGVTTFETKPQDEIGVTGATIFALVGDLGAGKTTFSKTVLKKLGVTQHVQSPTFSIINSYDLTGPSNKSGMTGQDFKKIFHIDVYRIENMNEIEVLHFDEILSNPEHIVLIEWADKIKAHIPPDAHWIYFEHDSMETRKVIINEIPQQVRDDNFSVRGDK